MDNYFNFFKKFVSQWLLLQYFEDNFLENFSKKFNDNRNNNEVNSKMASETVAKLLLKTSDLKKLRKSFEDIDIDDSGEIDYDEFLEHMEERRNAFTDAVFRLIDENGDGVLEFDEFVSICGSFCMWNRGEILKFCFDTCKFLIFFFCPFPLF